MYFLSERIEFIFSFQFDVNMVLVAVTCSGMPAVDNAVGTPNPGDNSQVDPGETGSYTCNVNFAPSGDSEITCNNDNNVGVWETPTFSCSREDLIPCFLSNVSMLIKRVIYWNTK